MKAPRKVDALPEGYRGREQTFIKHVILRRYLERVAWNILWSYPEFVFIDGFSGPWASKSRSYEDTSFGIAMRTLSHVRDELKANHQRARRVRCVFVEKRASAFERLAAAVEAAPYVEARAIPGRFEDCVGEICAEVANAFALILVDPKGWSFDLRRLGPLLRHRPSEVIISFMYDHVNRFLEDTRPEIRASYVLPFGDPDWRARFDALQASGLSREDAVLELFREQVKTVGKFGYVLSARIQRPTADRSHFYLVYGTRSPKGLIEFRRVEKKAMEAEELSRIEAKHDRRSSKSRQGLLHVYSPRRSSELRQPEIQKAEAWLLQQLSRARVLLYAEVLVGVLERFSVTETELKDLLVIMRDRGQVALDGMAPRQRKPADGVIISLRAITEACL